jgi:hypothetical protein
VVACLDAQMVMTLYNLGFGGFSVLASAGVDAGTVVRFSFRSPDGVWSTQLTAESVHSRSDGGAPGSGSRFVVGFKFMDADSPPVAASINALIDRATAVISFS